MNLQGLFPGASRWLLLALVIIAVDQHTKSFIVGQFSEFDSIAVLPWLDIVRLHNEGVAFSMFSEASGWQRWFFSGLGSVMAAAMIGWLCMLPRRGQARLALSLACIIGGAVGNVIDRLVYGHVIDFIHVHYKTAYFPAFNVADSAITVGAAVYILDSIISTGARSDRQSK